MFHLQFSIESRRQVAEMGIFSALLLVLFVGVGICDEFAQEGSYSDPLVPVTIFITAEQYQACKEYGQCTFNPQSVSLNEHGDIDGTEEGESCVKFCQKMHLKMARLESQYPEAKHLYLKMKEIFADCDFDSEKGQRIARKFLVLVRDLIEKLKVEFDDYSHVHRPEPIPTVEHITEEEIYAEATPEPIPTVEHIAEEEIFAEPEPKHDHPIFVGSLNGVPGIDFPNYSEIPITSFSCSDKEVIPGFYADLETGCQVFHLCYEHRRESFLCPVGTIFNQPILACDYWYSANCSLAPIYYEKPNIPEPEYIEPDMKEKVEHFEKPLKEDVDILKFLPVKGKVIEIPEFGKPITTPIVKPVSFKDTEVIADKIFDGILSLGNKVVAKTSDVLHKIPDPEEKIPFEDKLKAKAYHTLPFIKAKKVTSAAKLTAAAKIASGVAFTSGKAKMAAIPVLKSKVAAAGVLPMMKTKAALGAIPLVKAQAAALKVPVVKTKMALGAIPLVKADAAAIKALKAKKTAKAVALGSIPLVKAQAAALKVPLVKTKKALGAIPLVKADVAAVKAIKAKKTAVPYLKMAALKPKLAIAPLKVKSAVAVPLIKTKLAAAAVSPLTKKALALGYLKLLKAKKMTLMG